MSVVYAHCDGKLVIVPPRSTYAAYLHRLTAEYPMVSFLPADPEKYQRSAAAEAKLVTAKQEEVRFETAACYRIPPRSPILLAPTDGMLHAALDEYAEFLKKEHRKPPIPGDGSQITEWATTCWNPSSG